MFFHALTDTWKIGKWISCNDNTQTIVWSHKYYIYCFCFNQDYNASYKAESKLRKSPIVETSQNKLCTVQWKQNLNRFHTTRKKWLDWSREDHILGAVRQKIIRFKTHSSFFSVCCTQLFIVRKSNYGEETPKQKTSSKIGWKSGEVRRCNVTLTHWLTLKARPNARRIST